MSIEYDALLELMRSRRSVRRFTSQPVSREQLEALIEAARWAPSAGNRQAYRFLVVSSKEIIAAMGEAVSNAVEAIRGAVRPDVRCEVSAYLDNFDHFGGAPVVIVPIHRAGPDLIRSSVSSSEVDSVPARGERDALSSVAAAIMNLLLGAHAMGLGACWMTCPLLAAEVLHEILDVPRGWSVSAVIPVGYPDGPQTVPSRRELRRLVRFVE